MPEPLATIITSTFNVIEAGREKSFRQSLESIHNQTYKNIEHLIMDGASTDGTVKLLEEYAKIGWVRYVSRPDKGIYFAMNEGINLAKGKYISFLNTDDYYNSNTGVEKSVKALEDTNSVFSYAPVINRDEDTGTEEIIYPKISNVFLTIMPNHQTMFVRKDALLKNGLFDTKYRYVAEYDMTVKLCLEKVKSVYVEDVFVTYRLGGNSQFGTEKGIALRETIDIYYENYNKLCPVTLKECEKICGDIYYPNYVDVPAQLAEKFKNLTPYFDYEEYEKSTKIYTRAKIKTEASFKRFLKWFLPRRARQILKYWYNRLNLENRHGK